jgi:cAMP-dependent protein kinase regulator
MIKWLNNYSGHSNSFDMSTEKSELKDLRKEIKKYKKKYNVKDDEDDEMRLHSEPSEHDEEEAEDQDKVEELLEQRKLKAKQKGARSSVSAEVYGQFNLKKDFVPKVVHKSDEQIKRIQDKVLKSFIFNMLDDKELKIVIDAMEEYTCKEGDYVIKQGDPGAVLYIIEKGTYDCYKTFSKGAEPVKVKEYFPGDSFGELALLYNAPRAASIVAREDGISWTLDRETFNNIVKESAIKKRERYEAFLKSVSILKQIEPYELSQICDALKPKKFSAGDCIIQQNDEGDEFFIIEEGEAYATKIFKEGDEPQVVFEYERGGYFGELALLKNEPRAASVFAKVRNCINYIFLLNRLI